MSDPTERSLARATHLAAQKERLIYWVLRQDAFVKAYQAVEGTPHEVEAEFLRWAHEIREGVESLLADLNYDSARILTMMAMGEPLKEREPAAVDALVARDIMRAAEVLAAAAPEGVCGHVARVLRAAAEAAERSDRLNGEGNPAVYLEIRAPGRSQG